MEQILASHSAVEGVGELPHLAELANIVVNLPSADGLQPYPERLGQLSADDRLDLAETYLACAAAHRKPRPSAVPRQDAWQFRTGRADLELRSCLRPRSSTCAAIPLACGVALFRQHFGPAGGFANDLTEIGQTYKDYVALMDQIDRPCPAGCYRVIYEDLVADTEGEVRRLLAYVCGLPYRGRLPGVSPIQTQRTVMTPSAPNRSGPADLPRGPGAVARL